jgi:putative ABC transport system permease protein
MGISFLYTVLRQFTKDKVYTAINIVGLAVGVASTLLIAGYVIYELNYDRFYTRHRQMYRVYSDGIWSGKSLRDGHTPYPLAEALMRDFPEVESVTRCQVDWNRSVRYGDKHFYEDRFFYADSNFIDFFGFKVLAGNPKTMLSMPNSLVITASTASRYFGNEDPTGKAVRIENNLGRDTAVYSITGIIEDLHSDSHLKIDMLASMNTYPVNYRSDNWLGGAFYTYIRLYPMADPKQLDRKLESAISDYIVPDLTQYLGMSKQDYLNSENIYTFHLQPVADIHMNAEINDGLTVHGNARQIYILACIAVFILILACVNFTNLSTAQATLRAKEIGIRKISGASRAQIAFQFLGEVFLHVLAGTVLALFFAYVLQLPFARLMDRNFTIINLNPSFVLGIIILMFVTTLAAGSYPAFLVSSMPPLAAIKGKTTQLNQRVSLRTFLVLIQFILSVATAIAFITINRQMVYMERLDLGFNRTNMVVVERTDPLRGKIEPFIQELRKIPEVKAVSISSGLFGRPLSYSAYSREGKNPEDVVFFQGSSVDYDFAETYNLTLRRGRWFSHSFHDSASVIINETAAKMLGWDEPIGKRLFNPDGSRTYLTIIGVVKDFNFESLHTPIQPFVFYLNPNFYDGYFSIRFDRFNPESAIQKVKQIWAQFAHDDPLVYFYYDQEFNRMYRTEKAARNIMLVFTVLAVIISCMGLLGIASYTTGRRTKEVGIRKSFGASNISIVRLLIRHMIIIVAIANIIAWPLVWMGIERWLNDFTYRIHQNLLMPVLVLCGSLLMCLLTIIYHTLRVARSNPVDALRYE